MVLHWPSVPTKRPTHPMTSAPICSVLWLIYFKLEVMGLMVYYWWSSGYLSWASLVQLIKNPVTKHSKYVINSCSYHLLCVELGVEENLSYIPVKTTKEQPKH